MQRKTSETKTKRRSAAPWEGPAPKASRTQSKKPLTPSQKARAQKSAKAAGRAYPNLVDNMQAAKKPREDAPAKSRKPVKTLKRAQPRKQPQAERRLRAPRSASSSRPSTSRAGSSRESSRRVDTKRSAKRERAVGRSARAKNGGAAFREREAQGLKSSKPAGGEAYPFKLHRVDSGASHLAGSSEGKATRLVSMAAAWVERSPRTLRAAQAIAAKGRSLLERVPFLRTRAQA